MEEIARERQYTLIFGCTFYNPEEELCQANILIDHLIDSLILFCGYDEYDNVKKINEKTFF